MFSKCKDCERREVGCHSACNDYLEAKADWKKVKRKRELAKEYDYYQAAKKGKKN